MTPAKAMLNLLKGQETPRRPIWLMRQAGRYLPEYRALRRKQPDFVKFCLTPELAVEATLQPLRRYDLDAAILFSDILILPAALGQQVGFEEGRGPVLEPIRNPGDIARLAETPDFSLLEPVYEAVSGIAAALPPAVSLIGFAGSPWTVASYMVEGGTSRDHRELKGWAFSDPDGFSRLIDRLVTGTAEHLKRQIDAGAEIIQLFESWAGILPERAFRRWVIEPTARIVTLIRESHPDVPIIGFPRAAGVLAAVYRRETGIDAIGLDSTMPYGWVREALQSEGPVQGNIDPIQLVAGGAALDLAVDDLLGGLGDGPLVVNLGHGVLPMTPPENVSALIDRVRSHEGG